MENAQQIQQPLGDLGRHLVLDFTNIPITNLDVNSYEQVSTMFQEGLNKLNLEALSKTHKIFEPQGLTMLYALDHGHLTIRNIFIFNPLDTWPENQSCAIDFYHFKQSDDWSGWDEIRIMEEHICDTAGWEYCTSTVAIPRGKVCRIQTHDHPTSPEQANIMQNIKFIHREKTEFQDLRIYDSQSHGRIMTLDGFMVISDSNLEESYTIQLTDMIIQKDIAYQNVLIFGGGDFLIANYLHNRHPTIQNIIICDIDSLLIDNVITYFKFAQNLKPEIDSGKIQIVRENIISYMAKLIENERKFDRIIIDYNNYWMDTSPETQVNSPEFYPNLSKLLKTGGKFSKSFYESNIDDQKTKIEEAGFGNITQQVVAGYQNNVKIIIGSATLQ